MFLPVQLLKLMRFHFFFFLPFQQGLPLTQSDKLQELSGTWEKVFIPVLEPNPSFTVKSSYNLRHVQPGAVYEIVAIARNAYGWSEYSKVFNFFNKGVGKKKTRAIF